jgi:DNA-binding NarL/FixJ family response regulator
MKRLRLILADDHSLVLAGFRALLEHEFDVVATAGDGRSLVAAARELHPDIVLLDISMPLLNGIDAARHIRRNSPDTRIIFLSMHSDLEYVREALAAGASGYLLKRSTASELISAIQVVSQGGQYITPVLNKELRDYFSETGSSNRASPLTSRQREILQLIAEGRAMKEIAYLLNISMKTAQHHKHCLRLKLGVKSTAELTMYAIENGLLGP